jgi:hypothetical protein
MVEVAGRNPVGGDLVRVPAGDPLLPWNDFDPDALTSGSFHSRYAVSLMRSMPLNALLTASSSVVIHRARQSRQRPQLRLSSLQPAQGTADKYDAAGTIDNHAGGGKARAGPSAGDDDCAVAESVKVVCDLLRHMPHLSSMGLHRSLG